MNRVILEADSYIMAEDENQIPSSQVEFQDIEKEYQRKVTIVEAIPRLKKYGLLAWTILDVALLAIFFGYMAWYLIAGSFMERNELSRLAQNFSGIREISMARSAADPVVGNVSIFQNGEDVYDFYNTVSNPNDDWYATMRYYYRTNQGDVGPFEWFLLPGETRPIARVYRSESGRPGSVEFVLDHVDWKRVDAGVVDDVEDWLQNRDDFQVTDVVHEVGENGVSAVSRFTIKNGTPYSYWAPNFLLIVEQGGRAVGVNYVTLPGFESGETRTVSVNWFGSAPASGTLRIVPEINYFDEDVYMPPSSEREGGLTNPAVLDRRL